jgi:hypothetical protein
MKQWRVEAPDGKSGAWSVESFEVSKDGAALQNLRASINRRPVESIMPGHYKRLMHERRGVIMSNTQMEQRTNEVAWRRATGRVLINGLGLGMLLHAILDKLEVEYVRVIEAEADVIRLVWPTFEKHRGRAEIVHADSLEYEPFEGERFDFVWHDIWDYTGAAMIPTMTKLRKKWAKHCEEQLAWTEDIARQRMRESKAF